MAMSAELSTSVLTIAPGETAVCAVHVRNVGKHVGQFSLDVTGDASAWALLAPAVLTVPPSDEGIARLVFRPPRGAEVYRGEVPFAVRVCSLDPSNEGPTEDSVPGVVIVESYAHVTAVMLPEAITCHLRGRTHLAVHNGGNYPIGVDALATDPRQTLALRVLPSAAVIEPGAVRYFSVQARPRRFVLGSAPKTLPFHVLVLPEGMEPLAADGHVVHERVPAWGAALILLILVIGFIIGAVCL
jgi:hypothetical protein